MKFNVFDNKTGKEADPYEIALHEEWAQGLVYCDMEGFMLTENGDLMLADECGTYVYCDPERFKVVFEEERPHGEWIYKDMKGQFCSVCDKQSVWKFNFCPNCGSDNRPRILDESVDGEGKDENVKEGEKNESDHM